MFNENEIKVIKALIRQVVECTGNEFGYIEDVRIPEGLTKHQFAGYISDLKKKDIFKYTDDWNEFSGQYALTEEIFNIYQ